MQRISDDDGYYYYKIGARKALTHAIPCPNSNSISIRKGGIPNLVVHFFFSSFFCIVTRGIAFVATNVLLNLTL